jgi:CRP-like cAMP-binding protein
MISNRYWPPTPTIARRWLSSVAGRLAASQARILGPLGRNLSAQVAQLLLDEQHDGTVELAQRILAAMLGVQRPSLNKVLKDFERNRLITVLDPARLTRLAT